jgi:hypothetical protein
MTMEAVSTSETCLILWNYTVQYPRRLSSSCSPPWEPKISLTKYYYYNFLSRVFFLPWYFSSWASGEPHHSGFQVSDCSTFLMMCDVPSMAVFCRESIECCPGIVYRCFLNFCLQLRWPQWLLVWRSISCSTHSEFLYLYFYTSISFQIPFVLYYYLMVLLHQSISRFCPSCLLLLLLLLLFLVKRWLKLNFYVSW